MSSTLSGSLSAPARIIRSYSSTVIRRSPGGANGTELVVAFVDVIEDIVPTSVRPHPQQGRGALHRVHCTAPHAVCRRLIARAHTLLVTPHGPGGRVLAGDEASRGRT